MKFGLRDRQVFFPVSKAKFRLKLSRLADHNANESCIGIHFKQHFPNLLVRIPRTVTRSATQDCVLAAGCAVPRIGVLCVRGVYDLHAPAKTSQIRLAGEECQGRAPVRALDYFGPAGGPVGRHIKPRVCSVDDEEFLFRRLILPTHPPGL